MSRKSLQIYRNDILQTLQSKEDAISSIKTYVQSDADMSDGEIIAQRYNVTEGENTIVKTLLGMVAIKDGVKYLTIYESLDEVMKIIVDNEKVTEKGFETMNNSIGLDEHMELDFGDNELLKDCKSIKEAILKIAELVGELGDKYVTYEIK